MMSSTATDNAIYDALLDRVFHALSDRTRRALLSRLSEGSAMITELAKPFEMSLQAIGKHLKVLEKAGLVDRAVNGRVHRCSLNATPLEQADEWFAHYEAFWSQNLDNLNDFIQSNPDQVIDL